MFEKLYCPMCDKMVDMKWHSTEEVDDCYATNSKRLVKRDVYKCMKCHNKVIDYD